MRHGLSQAERRRYWRDHWRTRQEIPFAEVECCGKCGMLFGRDFIDRHTTRYYDIEILCRGCHYRAHRHRRDKRGRFARRKA